MMGKRKKIDTDRILARKTRTNRGAINISGEVLNEFIKRHPEYKDELSEIRHEVSERSVKALSFTGVKGFDDSDYISVIQDVLGINKTAARRMYKTISESCEKLGEPMEEYLIKI